MVPLLPHVKLNEIPKSFRGKVVHVAKCLKRDMYLPRQDRNVQFSASCSGDHGLLSKKKVSSEFSLYEALVYM